MLETTIFKSLDIRQCETVISTRERTKVNLRIAQVTNLREFLGCGAGVGNQVQNGIHPEFRTYC